MLFISLCYKKAQKQTFFWDRSLPHWSTRIIFCAFLSFLFATEKDGKLVLTPKKWFWPANGMRSTCSLVKIHNINPYHNTSFWDFLKKATSCFVSWFYFSKFWSVCQTLTMIFKQIRLLIANGIVWIFPVAQARAEASLEQNILSHCNHIHPLLLSI